MVKNLHTSSDINEFWKRLQEANINVFFFLDLSSTTIENVFLRPSLPILISTLN
jgi:hypothetical protein